MPGKNKLDALFTRYPLVKESSEALYSYLEAAYFVVCGDDGCDPMIQSIIETVEKTIDGTEMEKQAVMIGALYMAAGVVAKAHNESISTATLGTAGRVPEVTAMINAIDTSVKGTVLATPVARAVAIGAVSLIAHIANLIQQIPGEESVPPAAAKDMLRELKKEEKESEACILPNLNAPRLEAMYTARYDGIMKTLGIALPQKKAGKPKKGGSKPKI